MEIFVLPKELEAASSDLKKLSEDISKINSTFKRNSSSLDIEIKSKAAILRYINKLKEEFDKTEQTLKKHSEFIYYAQNEYLKNENDINAMGERLKFDIFGGNSGNNSNKNSDKFKIDGYIVKGEVSRDGVIGKVPVSGKVEGGFGYYKAELKPKISTGFDDDGNFDPKSFEFGVEGNASISAFKGSVEGIIGDENTGYLKGYSELELLTGAVSGEIVSTLFKDGKFDPNISAKIKGEISAIKGKFEIEKGNKYFKDTTTLKGSLLHAEVEGSVNLGHFKGKDGKEHFGVAGEVGAYACIAEGTASRKFNFLGIEIGTDVSGQLGAVGASAGGQVTTDGVKVSADLGLGLGAGVDLNVDWSGVGEYWSNNWDGIKNDAVSAWGDIKDGITGTYNAVDNWFNGANNWLRSTFG